jgi:hypothetical protein
MRRPRFFAVKAAACATITWIAACGGATTGDGPDSGAKVPEGGASSSGSSGGSSSGLASGSSSGAGPSSGSSSGGIDSGTGSGGLPIDRTHTLKARKVDLLFDIDNSASMGDKQAILAQAIPDLVTRLVTPNCVDAGGNVVGVSDANGQCASGGTVEFAPVRDMHIGILTSALGGRLGTGTCPTTGLLSMQTLANGTQISRHNDDQGHLINRGSDPNNLADYSESPIPDMGTLNFINWAPGATSSPTGQPIVSDPVQLQTDLAKAIVGVHQFGCGIESQLESWYRFLIQPDPYASLGLDSTGKVAQWVGIDTTILAQRAAFLRPDSLVAIIVVSDENDSEVDVRSFGGTAWNFMSNSFPPPRGTSACMAGDPATVDSAACTSCSFGQSTSDPSCQMSGGVYPTSMNTSWGFDLNLRHVHEKEKYGVSVQFPIERYVVGLTSGTVPDRQGEYPAGASSYQGLASVNQNCTNPLFAGALPAPPAGTDPSAWTPSQSDVCNLPPGTRDASLVYYSHIGGVPHQLLQTDPANPDSPQKDSLSPADWTLIVGKDPLDYDYSGIDPHMVESVQPRTSVPMPAVGAFPVFSPDAPEGTDPVSGRESITDSTMAEHSGLLVDLQYACTFKLSAPRDCSDSATSADPTLLDSCDCTPPISGTGSFTHDEIPAVCNDTTPTHEDSAKAYPTIRELLLAQLLGQVDGANPGIISSICPIHAAPPASGPNLDPLYGYRPAMNAIANRLKLSL